jgi:hypothetical protein
LRWCRAFTGLARSTISRGEDDLDAAPLRQGQVRREREGPRPVPELQRLVGPATPGDPERLLQWVPKSMDKLADTLTAMGHPIGADTVARELVKLGYSRQSNRKADEGSWHPDRDAQFEHINAKAVDGTGCGAARHLLDTKRKELVGNFKNGGTDYRPKGEPRRVNVHDFDHKTLGKVVPSGRLGHRCQRRLRQPRHPTPPSSPWQRSAAGWSAWSASATPRHGS